MKLSARKVYILKSLNLERTTEGRNGVTGLSARKLSGISGQEEVLSNTHLHTSQMTSLDTGGVDFVVWNLGVTWGASFTAEELMNALSAGKLKAQKARHDVTISVNGRNFAISARGIASGESRGAYCSYLLRHEGLTLKITKSIAADETARNANVVAECGSHFLMANGIETAWECLLTVIDTLGGNILWHKFSRLDLCADLTSIDPTCFLTAIGEGKYISRASSLYYYEDNRKPRGVTVGKGNIILRIYDKLHEVTVARPDKAKESILLSRRWGPPPNYAVRVEFQLRRLALNELGLDSMSDLRGKGAGVARYLTGVWFRILTRKPDIKNNHQTRAITAAEWMLVEEAFESWLGKAPQHAERAKRPFSRDSLQLVNQGIGCLLSAVVDLTQSRSMEREEIREHLHDVVDWSVDQVNDATLQKKYERKVAVRLVGWGGAGLPVAPRECGELESKDIEGPRPQVRGVT